MNKYFIICNAIWKGIDNWSYLINWSKVEVDEWVPAAVRCKEDIIELVLNHSQINRPYLFDSLKEAKESLIRIKANDLFEDYETKPRLYTNKTLCHPIYELQCKYYIVNFVPFHLNEVIEA